MQIYVKMGAARFGIFQIMVNRNIHKNTQFVHFINKQDDNELKAGQAGAIEVIVKAMNTHAGNANLCENGCEALRNITLNGN